MKPAQPSLYAVSPPLDRRHVQEWWVFAVLSLLLCAGLGYSLWTDHAGNRAQERQRLQAQSHVIEENLVRQLQGANSALAGLRYEMWSGDHVFDGKDLPLRLRVLADAMPGVRALLVLDASGVVLSANLKHLVGQNFRARAYFAPTIATHDYTALYVSEPLWASSGILIVGLSKAMAGPDQQPVGVVTAILDPGYFDILMRSVLYAPDMSINVSTANGRVFMVAPSDIQALDTQLDREDSVYRQHMQSGRSASVQLGYSHIHKDERMVSIHSIQPPDLHMTQPITVAVSRNLAAIDAPWRTQLRNSVCVLGLALLGAGITLGYVHNRRRAEATARHAVQRAQQETAQRFEFGLKGADLGLWDWHLADGTLTVNDRQWQMLGYTPGEVPLHARFWQSLLHPDDLPALQAAFTAHIKNGAAGYKLEHRIQHKNGQWLWVLHHAMVVERDPQDRAVRVLGTHLDITERKQAHAELAAANALLRRTGEIAKIGGWQLDLARQQLTWTDEVFRIHGLSVGAPPSLGQVMAHYSADARQQLDAAMQQAQQHGTPWALELEMTTAQGQDVWIRTRGEAVWQNGKAVQLMGTLQDISERMRAQIALKTANQQLAQLTITDGLTGVGNRRHFDQSLAAEWARSTRQRKPLALMMMDIDHFKLYNDHYGHPGGDACLREVARILNTCICRPGEILMRYGGEEFAILLLDTDSTGAAIVAQRCLDRLQHAAMPHATSRVSGQVTLSIGIASAIPTVGQNAEDLVQWADAALYQAKHQGRARYACAPAQPVTSSTPATDWAETT